MMEELSSQLASDNAAHSLPDTSSAVCRQLLDVLSGHGVKTVVVSPGSRNAPLSVAVSCREEFRHIVIPDERTAAFVALGIAMATKLPVAIICTSGTALYNYAPAVAEAFYQHIPLIVISADRPYQWIDQNDSQTLEQPGALGKIVKRSFNIPPVISKNDKPAGTLFHNEEEWFANRVANEAVLTALSVAPGPVHINIQLEEPLNGIVPAEKRNVRIIRNIEGTGTISPVDIKNLAERLSCKKVMVVAGFMLPDSDLNKALGRFSRLPNVTVLCETISNIHIPGSHLIDSLLIRMSDTMKEELKPDVVISIGGSLVSRMLKEYLRGSQGLEHWTLGDTDQKVDSFQHLTLHIDADPARFFSAMAGAVRKVPVSSRSIVSSYNERWNEIRKITMDEDRNLSEKAPWSELTALQHIITTLPPSCNIFPSNGTCIRYQQLFANSIPHACYCNRGVSGIDGTNASALGIASAYRGNTLLLTGDISFSYCPQILARKDLGSRFKIIVVNNSGGGIFRFIKSTRNLEAREEYFCAPQDLNLEGIARSYGWNYRLADDMNSLRKNLKWLWNTDHPLLEIRVNPSTSARALLDYMDGQYR